MRTLKQKLFVVAMLALMALVSSCAPAKYRNSKWRKSLNDCNCSSVQQPLNGDNCLPVYG